MCWVYSNPRDIERAEMQSLNMYVLLSLTTPHFLMLPSLCTCCSLYTLNALFYLLPEMDNSSFFKVQLNVPCVAFYKSSCKESELCPHLYTPPSFPVPTLAWQGHGTKFWGDPATFFYFPTELCCLGSQGTISELRNLVMNLKIRCHKRELSELPTQCLSIAE